MFLHCLRFYRSFATATLLITLACAYVYYKRGNELLGDLILLKLGTGLFIGFIANTLTTKESYYYYNLHISKRKLWIVTFLFDTCIFLFLLFLIHVLNG